MRSSKNRSRSKGNRNRSVGNIVNRVVDSSGPEGKVRGTPQQIIDKYNQLARDAQLSNDRVAAENFQQHAEHYLRMLAEAQREQDARQPYPPQQGGGLRERGEGDERGEGYGEAQPHQPYQPQQPHPHQIYHSRAEAEAMRQADRQADRQAEGRAEFDSVMDGGAEEQGGLVETPESAPKAKRSRSRRPKKAGEAGQAGASDDDASGSPQEAAE
jgi:hypothetical protein